jgi:hypothetical protein
MKNIFIIAAALLFSGISCKAEIKETSFINTAHLDHLYQDIVVNNDTLGIVHIYAEYPDYKWFDDSDEGTACVDDVARAVLFYLDYYKYKGDNASLLKAKRLVKYILYMQAENGWFYNFTWKDNSINKDFRTSVAEPNWWSWRAFRALAEAETYFRSNDPQLAAVIKASEERLLKVLLPWLDSSRKFKDYAGISLPAWLPYENAADQASIILEALSVYYSFHKDGKVLPYIRSLAEGIISMQAGSDDKFPFNAFLSWQNTWHAWGNAQAEAVLMAAKAVNEKSFINAPLAEIKYFYPYLLNRKYLSSFVIEKKSGRIDTTEVQVYSQIAYGLRPMITASLKAYEVTGDSAYAVLAGQIACWFFGDNPASAVMYDPKTGRGFDGIPDAVKVNKNSGAESTIESLLALLAVERNAIAKKVITDYYEKVK